MSRTKDAPHKTNAMRQLETAGVSYSVETYEVDESDLSGAHVAAQIGGDPDAIFKTLVLHGEKTGYLVCCIPVLCELDLKKVAVAAHDKRVEMIPMKQLFDLTGYIRGGCSPLGMKKQFPTYIDESALLYEEIAFSAGQRGMQIICGPEELASVISASFCDITAL